MDQLMGGGGGGAGGGNPLEQWFWEMPPVTRWWTAATLAISIAVQTKLVTPFQLFYSFRAVFVKNQFWRLLTTFIYFGPIELDLLIHIYFQQRYSRLLEESTGGSPAEFSWLLVYAMTSLILMSPLVQMPFLGHPLSATLTYIWSRRNPDTRMSFFGLLVFSAPYLPWVLMGFGFVMRGVVPKDDIMGVVIGHIYYFFVDVYPPMHGGHRPFDPPRWWRALFERQAPVEEDTHDDADAAFGGAEIDAAHRAAAAPAADAEVR